MTLVRVITEGHYIEPDRTVDPTPVMHLERTLRPDRPDGTLLTMPGALGEDEVLALVDAARLAHGAVRSRLASCTP